MALVPISKRALEWAVDESGYSCADLDRRLKLRKGTVEQWIRGDVRPNRTEFDKLRAKLRRPAAVFFMNTPPTSSESPIQMRFAFGAQNRSRSPEERVSIRDALCVRDFIELLLRELGQRPSQIPTSSTNEDPEQVARELREQYFRVSMDEQMAWHSPSDAFQHWRMLVERLNILVFLYSLGEDSARGFSFAAKFPPVIGVSTTWHPSVRVDTLFHELGHILTRTDSSCIEASTRQPNEDPVERWCEKFSACFLMPRESIQDLVSNARSADAIKTATRIANTLHVSRKSALLRLVELDIAEWSDFLKLQSQFGKKSGGEPANSTSSRTRAVIRGERYGSCLHIIRDAYREGIIGETEIRSYLQMMPIELA